MFLQSHVSKKIFQNLCVRFKLSIREAVKIKLLVALEIQYFELIIFSFNSFVYYLTRGFIASTCAFSLITRAVNLPTRAFNLPTRDFSLLAHVFKLVTHGFKPGTCGFGLITRNSYFTFPLLHLVF